MIWCAPENPVLRQVFQYLQRYYTGITHRKLSRPTWSQQNIWKMDESQKFRKSHFVHNNFKRKCDNFKKSVVYQKIMSTEWYITFDVGWLYTLLIRCWKVQNLHFLKKFWVPFGAPRLTVKSHLYASLIYLLNLFKNWNEISKFEDSMGTIVAQKVCVANFEIKASKFYISRVIMNCLQDSNTLCLWTLMLLLDFKE